MDTEGLSMDTDDDLSPELEELERKLSASNRLAEERYNELRRTKRALGSVERERAEMEETLAKVAHLHHTELSVPDWTRGPGPQSNHIARPVLMLSDLHLDEVVDLAVMDGYNEFNREVAEERLERVVNGTVAYLNTYVSGVEYDGITVMLGGDIVTGTIHEELANTNAAPLPDTVQFWTKKLASAISYLADEFGRVHVPAVDGNHDRAGKKKQHKLRAQDSWAWTMYCMLAYIFRDDDRVDITVSESSELLVPVFDTNILLVHGDGAKGGNGIGGIWPPIARYVHKKQGVYASQGRPFDLCVMGHFHQLVQGGNFFINGSLKGYDEYAKNMSFPFERPQQMLFLVTPERGVTLFTGIHADE